MRVKVSEPNRLYIVYCTVHTGAQCDAKYKIKLLYVQQPKMNRKKIRDADEHCHCLLYICV